LWVLVVGLDLYVFFNRRWAQGGKEIPVNELVSFTALLAAAYIVAAPLVIWLSTLTFGQTLWLLAVIVTEHLSQELNRLLIALERHLQAVCVQLLRNFVWVAAFFAVTTFGQIEDPLITLLGFWAAGGVLAVLAGWFFIHSNLVWATGASTVEDLLKTAMLVVLPSLATTLALRLMLSLDRLIATATLPPADVAVYGLYVTIGAGATALSDISVTAFLYPRTLQLLKPGAIYVVHRTQSECRRGLVQIVMVQVTTAAAGWLLIVAALDDAYRHAPILYIVVQIAFLAYSMSQVPNAVLYALGRFSSGLAATVVAFSAFLGMLSVSVWFGVSTLLLAGAVLAGFLVMFAAKAVAAQRFLRLCNNEPAR
jgi:O-antigen/teichoic acid export membrane protein